MLLSVSTRWDIKNECLNSEDCKQNMVSGNRTLNTINKSFIRHDSMNRKSYHCINSDSSVSLYSQNFARLIIMYFKSIRRFELIISFCWCFLLYQASEKKEHKFKFATHMPSKMEQVNIVWHVNTLFMYWRLQQRCKFLLVKQHPIFDFVTTCISVTSVGSVNSITEIRVCLGFTALLND